MNHKIILAAVFVPLWLPVPATSPGATNPLVTQQTIEETICVPGWPTKERPPMQFTETLKRHQLRDARYADKRLSHYREDHIIPLGVGGAPNDPRNLWPQTREGACNDLAKDELERTMHRLVCIGKVPLAEAQAAFMPDWTVGYARYVGPLVCQ